jgi:hypothetical protein
MGDVGSFLVETTVRPAGRLVLRWEVFEVTGCEGGKWTNVFGSRLEPLLSVELKNSLTGRLKRN